jgi:hypothetical protein
MSHIVDDADYPDRPDHTHQGHQRQEIAIRISLVAEPGQDHAADHTAHNGADFGMKMIDQRRVDAIVPCVKIRRTPEGMAKDAAEDKTDHSRNGQNCGIFSLVTSACNVVRKR